MCRSHSPSLSLLFSLFMQRADLSSGIRFLPAYSCSRPALSYLDPLYLAAFVSLSILLTYYECLYLARMTACRGCCSSPVRRHLGCRVLAWVTVCACIAYCSRRVCRGLLPPVPLAAACVLLGYPCIRTRPVCVLRACPRIIRTSPVLATRYRCSTA